MDVSFLSDEHIFWSHIANEVIIGMEEEACISKGIEKIPDFFFRKRFVHLPSIIYFLVKNEGEDLVFCGDGACSPTKGIALKLHFDWQVQGINTLILCVFDDIIPPFLERFLVYNFCLNFEAGILLKVEDFGIC